MHCSAIAAVAVAPLPSLALHFVGLLRAHHPLAPSPNLCFARAAPQSVT